MWQSYVAIVRMPIGLLNVTVHKRFTRITLRMFKDSTWQVNMLCSLVALTYLILIAGLMWLGLKQNIVCILWLSTGWEVRMCEQERAKRWDLLTVIKFIPVEPRAPKKLNFWLHFMSLSTTTKWRWERDAGNSIPQFLRLKPGNGKAEVIGVDCILRSLDTCYCLDLNCISLPFFFMSVSV